MSYRSITVDGIFYEYSIGRTHVKFRDGPAVPYTTEDSPIAIKYDDEHLDVQVTPDALRRYIRRKRSPLNGKLS